MPESMDDFLTEWILHDSKLITYRLLSRARGLHVQEAKAALQVFFERTSSKKPLALSAIYVLKGTLKSDGDGIQGYSREGAGTDGDVEMTEDSTQASIIPDDESKLTSTSRHRKLPETIPRKQLLLVSADKLEETKTRFSSLTTAHIYSLAPGPDPDASKTANGGGSISLAEASRKQLPLLATVQHDLHSNQDYVLAWEKADRGKALGVIWNANAEEDVKPKTKVEAPEEVKSKGKGKAAEEVKPKLKAKTAEETKSKTKAEAAEDVKSKAKTKAAEEAKIKAAEEAKSKAKAKAADEAKSKAKAKADAAEQSKSKAKAKAREEEEEEDEEEVVSIDRPQTAKRRVTKTRMISRVERSKDERGYTVRKTVQVEEEYTTDESSDERPKPTKIARKSSTGSKKASPPPAPERAPSPAAAPASKPAPKPAPKPASKPPPAPPKKTGSGFGSNKSGSGSGSGSAASKKPIDKRQQTLGSFFKKAT
ncbi:hypothetical protein CF319_g3474 [Tilletia indica]|nr:hypothetical protein CF319_g3474 [Tilletia indica]